MELDEFISVTERKNNKLCLFSPIGFPPPLFLVSVPEHTGVCLVIKGWLKGLKSQQTVPVGHSAVLCCVFVTKLVESNLSCGVFLAVLFASVWVEGDL